MALMSFWGWQDREMGSMVTRNTLAQSQLAKVREIYGTLIFQRSQFCSFYYFFFIKHLLLQDRGGAYGVPVLTV